MESDITSKYIVEFQLFVISAMNVYTETTFICFTLQKNKWTFPKLPQKYCKSIY